MTKLPETFVLEITQEDMDRAVKAHREGRMLSTCCAGVQAVNRMFPQFNASSDGEFISIYDNPYSRYQPVDGAFEAFTHEFDRFVLKREGSLPKPRAFTFEKKEEV